MSLNRYTPEFKRKVIDLHKNVDGHTRVLLTNMGV